MTIKTNNTPAVEGGFAFDASDIKRSYVSPKITSLLGLDATQASKTPRSTEQNKNFGLS